MNILFLSLSTIDSFDNRGIYSDLMRELIKNGHTVFSVSTIERRKKTRTYSLNCGKGALLVVKTFNIQKTNMFEKGIGIIAIKDQFIKAIEKHFQGIKFDLILYPTPPITLCGVVEYFKRRDNAKTYLMLKDIFPQNAVDIDLLKTNGFKGLIYKYFRKQEKKLYAVSDIIGCMSPANVKYVLKHNPEIKNNKVEVFPNCIEVQNINLTEEEKKQIRFKYKLPLDKKIFIYGGNLGKPQGIPFIIDCLKAEKDNEWAYFLIIGDGTEYPKLEQYLNESGQSNFKLLKSLPSNDYDRIVASSDVGLIFLDHRFTIPNFPSRILSYMQAKLPILACTDISTDVGKIVEENHFGWWCESNNVEEFSKIIKQISLQNLSELGINAKNYLVNNYSTEAALNILENSLL